MKARLLRSNGSLQLLLCTGVIKMISVAEAKEFILSYYEPAHYDGAGEWDDDLVSMEAYTGNTIAQINDDGTMLVIDGETFGEIVSTEGVKFLTVPEYAALHGKKTAIVRRFCLQGRLQGAVQKGSRWLIPEDTPYPTTDGNMI